jgi:filamentous hemagglutinin
MRKLLRKLVSIILILTFTVFQLSPLFAAALVADGTTNTTIDVTSNGTPMVNIATPNSQGLSHNKYSDFNVDDKNMVMNNSKDPVGISKIGDYVPGNTNLINAGREANVILNEVTSNRNSTLSGAIEIYGRPADFILANPNGITFNGATVINSPAVTFVTGTPQIKDGMVSSFNMSPTGVINITGRDAGGVSNLGLDLQNADYANIASRVITVAGKIYAKTLNLLQGNDKYDYQSNTITSKTGVSNPSSVEFGIDSTVFGGMYAGRISITATENGFGVRTKADLVSNVDDILLNSNGTIDFVRAEAKRDIKVEAKNNGNIVNSETVKALNNVTLIGNNITAVTVTAGNNIGITSSADTSYATLEASKDITLTASGKLTNTDHTTANGNISLNSGSISDGKFYGTNIGMTVLGDATYNAAETSNDILLNIGGKLTNTDHINSMGKFDITAGSIGLGKFYANNNLNITTTGDATYGIAEAKNDILFNIGGILTNTDHTTSMGEMDITSGSIDDGKFYGNKNIKVTTTNDAKYSIMEANNDILLDIGGNLENTDHTTAMGAFNINANSISAGKFYGVNTSTITTTGNATYGIMESNGDAFLTIGGQLTNTDHTTSMGNMIFNAGSIGAGKFYGGNNLNMSVVGDAAYEVLESNNDVTFDIGGTLTNTDHTTALKNISLTANTLNSASFNAGTDMTLTLKNIAAASNILAYGNLNIFENTINGLSGITNSGIVKSVGNFNITGSLLNNLATGYLYSGGLMTINNSDFNNAGKIESVGNIEVTATNAVNFTDLSSATSNGNISIISKYFDMNSNNSSIAAAKSLYLTTSGLTTNKGSLLSSEGITINTNGNEFNNYYKIQTDRTLNITAGVINNYSNGYLYAGKLLDSNDLMKLDSTGSFSNYGTIETIGDLKLTATGSANFYGGSNATSNANITINSSSFGMDSNGKILAVKTAAVNTSGLFTNSGIFTIGDSMTINTNGSEFKNYGALQSAGAMSLTAGLINNYSSGYLYSGGDMNFTSSNNINNYNTIASYNNMLLSAANYLNFYNGSNVGANGNITLSAPNLTLDTNTSIKAQGLLSLNKNGDLTNNGLFQGGSVAIRLTNGALTNNSQILSIGDSATDINKNGSLSLITSSLTNNSNSKIHADGSLTIDAGSNLTNNGTVESCGNMSLSASNFNTTQSIISGGDMTIAANGFTNNVELAAYGNMNLLINGDLTNNSSGQILANNDLSIFANNLYNNINGYIYSHRDSLYKIAGTVRNEQAVMYAGRNMIIRGTGDDNSKAASVYNKVGEITADNGDMTIKATDITNISIDNIDVPSLSESDMLATHNYIMANWNTLNTYCLNSANYKDLFYNYEEVYDRYLGLKKYTGVKSLTDQEKYNIFFHVVTTERDAANLAYLQSQNAYTITNTYLEYSDWWSEGDVHANRYQNIYKYTPVSNVHAKVENGKILQGKILAGNNINIFAGDLTNQSSIITAQNNLNINATNVYNIKPSFSVTYRNSYYERWHNERSGGWHFEQIMPATYTTAALYSQTPAVLSGNNVTIIATNKIYNDVSTNNVIANLPQERPTINPVVAAVANTGILDPLNLPQQLTTINTNITGITTQTSLINTNIAGVNVTNTGKTVGNINNSLPAITSPVVTTNNVTITPGAGFTAKPDTGYLFQNNNRFVNEYDFIGSNYFITRLGYNPNKDTEKFLGDAVYEQKMVQDAILAVTGNHYLYDGVTSMNGQMTTLYDNAAAENSRLNFEFGKDLSADQIKNLKKDIIWYVQRKINDCIVLVPMVYLCEGTRATLDTSSSCKIYAKNDVKLMGGDLVNSGTIKGKNTIVQMNNDIANINGKIIGDNSVSLKAGGNIKNISLVNTDDFGILGITSKLSGEGLISSGGKLDMTAGKTIEIKAGNITAGGNTSFKANDIKITTVKLTNQTQLGSGDNMVREKTETNVGSNIKVGADLDVKTTNDTRIEGSNVTAQGNANLDVGGNLEILSVTDTYDKETRSKNESGGFCGVDSKTTVTVTKETSTTQVGSKLNIGGNLTANADKDITVLASDVNVGKNAAISATGDINILAGQNTTSNYSSKTSDDLLNHSEDVHIHNSINQIASGLNVGGNLSSMSGGDTTVYGSNMTVGGSGLMVVGTSYDSAGNIVTNKDASLNVLSATNSEYDYTYKQSTSKDIGACIVATAAGTLTGGVQGGIAGFQAGQNAQNGNTKIKETYDTTEAGSLLNFGGGLTTVSSGNTNIISSKITTGEDAQIFAGKGFDNNGNLTTVNSDAGILVGAKEEIHNSKSSEEILRASYLGAAIGGALSGVASNIGGGIGGAAGGLAGSAGAFAGQLSGSYATGNYVGNAAKNVVNDTEKNTTEITSTKLASSEITSGGTLTLSGEKQILVQASNLKSSGDTNLISKGNVTVTSGEEDIHSKTTHSELSFDNVDFSSTRSSVSMNLSQKGNEKETETDTTHQKSSNVTTGGNFNISSGGDTAIISSNILNGGKTNIDAKGNVTIGALKDTSTTTTKEGTLKNTFTATVGNAWVESGYSACDAYNSLSELGKPTDFKGATQETITAVSDAKAMIAGYNAGKAAFDVIRGISTSGTFGFYGSVSMTQEHEDSTSSLATTKDIGSVIYGNGINIKSGNDITAKGAYLKAVNGDVSLDAKNNIKIESGETTQTTSSGYEKQSLTTVLATTAGPSLPTMSIAKGQSSSSATTQNNSQLLADNGTIKMTSGEDTNLMGVNVKGKDIDMTGISGKLNLESKQDTSQSSASSYSLTLGQTVGFSISELSSSSAWANSQSSIVGTNSVNIKANELNMVGSTIANQKTDGTDGGNLNVEANTLNYSDLNNKSTSNGYSFSLGTSFGSKGPTTTNGTTNKGATKEGIPITTMDGNSTAIKGDVTNQGSNNWADGSTNIGGSYTDKDKEGITKSTIGNGNITTNSNIEGIKIKEPILGLGDITIKNALNRDITNTSEITKDKDNSFELSNTSISNQDLSDFKNDGPKEFFTNKLDQGVDSYNQSINDIKYNYNKTIDGAENLLKKMKPIFTNN